MLQTVLQTADSSYPLAVKDFVRMVPRIVTVEMSRLGLVTSLYLPKCRRDDASWSAGLLVGRRKTDAEISSFAETVARLPSPNHLKFSKLQMAFSMHTYCPNTDSQ
jgi:hypothetical protein